MEDHAADELHVVMPHVEETASPFAADGKGLDQQIVERFAGLAPLTKIGRLLTKLLVALGLIFGLSALTVATLPCSLRM